MNRDLWLPAFGLAFVVLALTVLVAVCRQSVVADQQPAPTRTPTVELTYTPAPTVTAYVAVSTPFPTLPPAPTSTLTPLPAATATQGRWPEDFNTPIPTMTVRAPVQAPRQIPRSNP